MADIPSATLENETAFSALVAQGTGLDFYTVEGWVGAEKGPWDNPLGIMHPGTQSLEHFGTPEQAAAATVQLLKSGAYASVLATGDKKGRTGPDHGTLYQGEQANIAAQAKAISLSPWKGNDGLPRWKYEQNIRGQAALAIYEGLEPNSKVVASGDGGPTVTENPVTGPTITGPDWLQPLLDYLSNIGPRIAIAIAGIGLVLIGAKVMLG